MRAPEFWRHGGLWPALLSPLGAAYDLAGRLRRLLARPVEVGPPVICVGNLVAGGAGKTPVAISLLALLQSRGWAAHGLTRGYGGRLPGPLRVDPAHHDAGQVGDEALLLARAAPTWMARDRAAGARAAAQAGAQAIVMDDGLQNPRLAKRLSLVVIDGAYGFGNAKVIPAGPLREPIARGLARAQAAILLGEDTSGVGAFLANRLPILRADLAPRGDAPSLAGRRILAFAGIGRPEKFFATLEAMGAILIERQAFADHYRYRRDEIENMIARAESAGAMAVTTEKDQVRLPVDLRDRVTALPVKVVWHDPGKIESLLTGALEHQPRGAAS